MEQANFHHYVAMPSVTRNCWKDMKTKHTIRNRLGKISKFPNFIIKMLSTHFLTIFCVLPTGFHLQRCTAVMESQQKELLTGVGKKDCV